MPQGAPLTFAYSYAHISTSTTTTIKAGPGILNSITINNPGSTWTVTVNDGGVPIAVITAAAAQSTLMYECNFNTSLSITTAGTTAGDITVTYQ